MDYKIFHSNTKKRLRGRFFFSTRNVVALHAKHYTPQDTTRRRLYTALAHYAYNKVRTRDGIVA